MLVCVVCTGNVARSPTLAYMLQHLRPDLEVVSAAVGERAVAGRPMARPLRELLTNYGLGEAAEQHRSQLFVHLERRPDVIIAFQRSHLKRLAELGCGVEPLFYHIKDPAFGGLDGYVEAWNLIAQLASYLARTLPRGENRESAS